MAINPRTLEAPERGAAPLTTRADEEAEPTSASPRGRMSAADELRALRAKIEAARKVVPKGSDLHCRDCFQRGRDAALRAIEET